ncbi:MAG: ATP-dependent helicase [Bacteroidia bacterium]
MTYYLDELNPVQKAAVKETEGPVMIIAGAGSGKTRVLTYRIAHLMEKGIDPFNILALTFTNKAAREMKERISKIVGAKEAKNLWMGTFHSIFAKILRIEALRLGYPSNFTIYDTEDSKNVIKSIVKQFNLDDKIYKPSLVLHRISDAKNKLISSKQYLNNSIYISEDRQSNKPLLGQIFDEYQKRNFKAGAMDFDDLLFNTNILLRDFPEVLIKYQNKFRYILVDEYQDTNFSQYLIVKQLAAKFQNICVVGDDAQSIYAFRGANIQNILNFETDYPDLKTFKLEQNYRSTKTIVEAANKIIANNKDQFKKTVFTDNDTGNKIKVFNANTDNEEGQKVANSIFETKNTYRYFHKDFAVLYRTNAQSRSIEEAFRRMNIPYRIYGGISFYQRKEIKDLLAYFRLTINPHDNESLKRIINYPLRGIGQTTLDKLSLAAAEHDVSIFTVCENLKDFKLGINSGSANKIDEFVTKIKSYILTLSTKDAYELGNHIAVNTGLVKELYDDKTPEGVSRYENIQELLNGLKDFAEQKRTPQENELNDIIKAQFVENDNSLFADSIDKELRTLDEFMQEITLLTDADEDEDDKNLDKVTMMTIHAAKGLEFKNVYIVGLEENLFPSQLSLNSRTELEEERRLFYVAVTRAQENCTLSYANSRFKYGNIIYCEPSRFIEEIDEDFLEYETISNDRRFDDNVFEKMRNNFYQKNSFDQNKFAKTQNTNFQKKDGPGLEFKPKPTLVRLSSSLKSQSPKSPVDLNFNRALQIGDVVFHEKFGRGHVAILEGNWPETKATIQIDQVGAKNLLLKFARLQKSPS